MKAYADARPNARKGVSVLTSGARVGFALAGLLTLAGCGSTGMSGPFSGDSQPARSTPGQTGPLAAAAGNTIGTGPIRIALILPLTQGSGPSGVGQSLRNAAELAMSESGSNAITLLVKDDQSTPEGARAAAQAALDEGAQAIVGPLFAPNMREVGRVARAANKPVIAFSTDTSAVARGVYALSFLVETQVTRVVDYAVSRGKKSFAALVPENEYGNVALAQFQTIAAARGVRVQAIERYRPGAAAESARKIAGLADGIDALFVPEQADQMAAVGSAITGAGIDVKRIQMLGTGIWNDSRAMRLPALQGALFAAPDNAGFSNFAQKYRAKFNADPVRIATLSYDAVSLLAALAQMQGGQGFSEATLTNADGFKGADGLFRFRTDGQNERGLSVLQIRNGTTTVVSPAEQKFTTAPGT
jgi:ABC-type branched-subunit amino acid transport system substrate-binding protein